MKRFKNMVNKSNKLIIIIMGPPGAGKGTQALLLAEKLRLYYYEPSKILENRLMDAKKNDYVTVGGKKISLFQEKINWKTGKIVSPELIVYWGGKIIENLAKSNEGIILAGSPRTVYEAERIMPLLEKFYKKENIKIILLDLPPEQTFWRNSRRKICTLMRHPIIYHKDTTRLKICPLDGSSLITRVGLDSKKSIKVRIEEYKNKTFPVIDYFKKNKYDIININATPSPSKVFSDICKALKTK